VLRPGGRLVVVDYATPHPAHPLRLLWLPVLRLLEPFARDLWRCSLTEWLPPACRIGPLDRRTFFGGLYQLVSVSR
jgi:hypothetical protein